MEKTLDQLTRTEPQTRLVERINTCLRAGDYSRALDLLRALSGELNNDAELSDLEKRARDGLARNADANRLITESQELFAQQKPAEAIQLLRQAYELDKKNSLARSILANALVEHAHSLVETDWLQAETLTNQALALNPAHPTAKTIHSLIVERKETSSVEDWVAQARKLQSSGDLFAALGWVAEGLAVHPDDPQLIQIQDAIQRDQGARRRQARRGDLDDLRSMQREIDGATDVAAKQALATRIQTVAAKHWTDGEILSIANALLLRLGLVSKDSSGASQRGGATVILHVPRPGVPEASGGAGRKVSIVAPRVVPSEKVSDAIVLPHKAAEADVAVSEVPAREVLPAKVSPSIAPPVVLPAPTKQLDVLPAATVPEVAPSAPAADVATSVSEPNQPAKPNSLILFLIAAAIVLVAATFFFTRKHYEAPVAKNSSTAAALPATADHTEPAPVSAPAITTEAPTTSIAPSDSPAPSDGAGAKVAVNDPQVTPAPTPASIEPVHSLGTLLIIAGQDGASVLLNGKLQPQLTHGGQLRVPNLELKEYVVQVSKSGFQNPPQQKVNVRKGEQATLSFNLQAQPRLATLAIQGGSPGTTVFVDQAAVGTVQADGTLSVSTVNPGDHTVELRNDRFKPRQFKKTFPAGGAIALTAADAALEAAPGELKISFSPANASVAIAKGDLLKMVSSGVPLTLAAGTYTLTARTAERFTRSSTLEVVAGQSRTLDLSLAPSGMSKWDDPAAWKQDKDAFIRRGGEFVLYGDVPASGTFVFSAMPAKGRLLQWVLNYIDAKNYVLFQIDENNFYRTVIRNGEKRDQIIVPDKGDKKSFRTLQVRVSGTEIVHQVKDGDRWTVLDRWTQPGSDLSAGKFGFYIPGSDEVAVSSFAHYVDLNLR